jgi:hypothetical protein
MVPLILDQAERTAAGHSFERSILSAGLLYDVYRVSAADLRALAAECARPTMLLA